MKKNWTLFDYLYCVSWWKGKSYGNGHFNEDLYLKVLNMKFQIEIQNQPNTNAIN